MTHAERIDQLVESSLRRWRERLLNTVKRHERNAPIFEKRAYGDIPAGSWVYFAPGAPFGYIESDRRLAVRGARYSVPETTEYLIKTGVSSSAPCDCVACVAHRTCFVPGSAAA